jgi:hypothetical protein
MEEAVEICKLRLFLKLVAQIERFAAIEPLPDIDFNIRAGNTLVGFATYVEAERAITSKLDFDNAIARIEQKAQEVELAFHDFRTMQTAINVDPELMAEMKLLLRSQLSALNGELDRYLASEYGIDRSNIPAEAEFEERFQQWRQGHQPFHWFVEFYGIMQRGGFDVIIGNPPYVEYSKVRKEYTIRGYKTESCGNLYAYVIERCMRILHHDAWIGLIVPHSIAATYRMSQIQKILLDAIEGAYSYFSRRPGKLFEGADQCLCIFTGTAKEAVPIDHNISTTYQRWYTEERKEVFEKIRYAPIDLRYQWARFHVLPKLGEGIESAILEKLICQKPFGSFMRDSGKEFYCHRITRYFIKSTNFVPYFCSERDGVKRSDDFKVYYVADALDSMLAVAVLDSSLFYWFWRVMFDGYHCGKDNIAAFPFEPKSVNSQLTACLQELVTELMTSFQQHAERKSVRYKGTGIVEYDEFNVKYSKPIIDEIDRVLAQHYGFTDEELDFIINYDIKYRMGRSDEEDEGE